MNSQTLTLDTPIGMLRLAASDAGLLKIALGNETQQSFANWLARYASDAVPGGSGNAQDILRRAANQLEAYFAGEHRVFNLPFDMRGTDFQQDVWRAVAQIPFGETRTYRQIAVEVCAQNAARAVGAANGANPLPIVVPCHRVIGSDGALRGYAGGLDIKASLLAFEKTPNAFITNQAAGAWRGPAQKSIGL